METLDCRVTFRDIAHRNEPKASRLAGFAIHNQFNFRNSAERLKEFPTFCYVKGKISDVKLHGDIPTLKTAHVITKFTSGIAARVRSTLPVCSEQIVVSVSYSLNSLLDSTNNLNFRR